MYRFRETQNKIDQEQLQCYFLYITYVTYSHYNQIKLVAIKFLYVFRKKKVIN